jgi:hypothetical protein
MFIRTSILVRAMAEADRPVLDPGTVRLRVRSPRRGRPASSRLGEDGTACLEHLTAAVTVEGDETREVQVRLR